jgi:arsenite transporter
LRLRESVLLSLVRKRTCLIPIGWETAVMVIVRQTLVGLLGMTACLRWVPGRLLPDRPLTP